MLPNPEADGPIAARRARREDAQGAEALRFRRLLAALGSGERTGRNLSREEAGEALDLLLGGRVDPAAAGAFLIAHRMRRPQAQELAGMVESYRRHSPRLDPGGFRPEPGTVRAPIGDPAGGMRPVDDDDLWLLSLIHI